MSQRFSVNVNGAPDIALGDSGDPSIRPVAAAMANAIFDATG